MPIFSCNTVVKFKLNDTYQVFGTVHGTEQTLNVYVSQCYFISFVFVLQEYVGSCLHAMPYSRPRVANFVLQRVRFKLCAP